MKWRLASALTLNTNKARRDDEVMRLAPGTIDEIKIELLERRREIVVDEYGRETVEEVDEEEDEEPLTNEQLEYLIGLLKDPDIDESDAELVLTVLKSRDEDVLEHLTGAPKAARLRDGSAAPSWVATQPG